MIIIPFMIIILIPLNPIIGPIIPLKIGSHHHPSAVTMIFGTKASKASKALGAREGIGPRGPQGVCYLQIHLRAIDGVFSTKKGTDPRQERYKVVPHS